MILARDKTSSRSSPRARTLRHDCFPRRFDHLRREASEYQTHAADELAEPWRSAFEKELTDYIKERYTYGASMVIGASDVDTITLAAFIESHKFEPKNFWSEESRTIGKKLNALLYL